MVAHQEALLAKLPDTLKLTPGATEVELADRDARLENIVEAHNALIAQARQTFERLQEEGDYDWAARVEDDEVFEGDEDIDMADQTPKPRLTQWAANYMRNPAAAAQAAA